MAKTKWEEKKQDPKDCSVEAVSNLVEQWDEEDEAKEVKNALHFRMETAINEYRSVDLVCVMIQYDCLKVFLIQKEFLSKAGLMSTFRWHSLRAKNPGQTWEMLNMWSQGYFYRVDMKEYHPSCFFLLCDWNSLKLAVYGQVIIRKN